MEKARQYLLLEGLKTGFDGSSDESTHSSPIKKRRPEGNPDTHSSFWKCYDEVAAEQKSFDNTGTTSLISTELDAYLKIGRISRCDNPYTWWAANRNLFPHYLANLAAIYLSAPGSSVYSERLFSEAGNIYEEKKNRLLPSNAEKLIFLHHNLPLLNFKYD